MVKYNKKILAIGIAFIGLFVLGIIGLTYAFFTAGVEGNQNANETVIETADLRLVFTDTQNLTLNNALPGASASKTLTVENIGNADISYDIELINVTNTFINNELIYTITSTNDGGAVTNEVMPNSDGTLISNITVGTGVTQTYSIEVKFKETGTNQNTNQGAAFTGKLQIVPRIAGVALAGYVYDESNNPMNGVAVEVHSDPVITTTDDAGYYEISDIPVGIHTIYIKDGEIILASKEVTLVSSDESIIEGTNTLKLPKKPNKYTNLKLDSGLININLINIPTLKDRILADNIVQSDSIINFSYASNGNYYDLETEEELNDPTKITNGLYYTVDNQYGEDEERIYYFRGRVDNNWVSFAGYLWRIVRTTSEGGVRLAYSGDGSATSSGIIYTWTEFNINSNSNYYVGYTYNTNGYIGAQTDSTIKTAIDTWYNSNLNSYSNYLSDTAVYCNDRSNEKVEQNKIYYPACDRIITNKRPSYACASANASRYTVSTETGNGYLSNPIALLSADEVYYAGLSDYYTINPSSYIMDNASSNSWWTMSPYNFNGLTARVYNVNSSGNLGESNVALTNGVRPAVSLKSSVVYTGGDGSKSNPYTIE